MTLTPVRFLSLFGLVLVLGSAACARQLEANPPPRAARPTEAAAPPGVLPPPRAPSPPPPGAPPEDDGPITAGERSAVIDALTAALDQHYVFADKAKALGDKLRDRQQHGAYASLARGQAFAHTLTEDMAAVVHDKHLEVRYVEHAVEPVATDDEEANQEANEQRYLNYGVFEVRRMRFNIGLVNFNAFGRPVATAADKLAAAMRLLADTEGLIVDLRECHGGDTDTVALAESYFFPAHTHLLDMYQRATNTTEHVHAQAELAGPRYAAAKPMFVLIGEGTASGCEAFAYAMQARKRATVIGGHSAGAAYFGDPRRLTDHFMAFVPIGRPIDPITHGDWEGTGVIPTIAAAPDQALAVAERAVLQVLEPQERNGRRRAAMQKRLAELR